LLAVGFALVLALLSLSAVPAEGAATLPEGFGQSRVATGLDRPTAMTLAPDGRIFVAEQAGRLRVIKNGRLLSRPFARFNVNSEGERGLLGVALDPNFNRNGFVYVYLTTRSQPVHNRVVRLKAAGDRASGRKLIFRLNNLSQARNHNGGALHFGRDGRLYIAVGDNARAENAQTLRNLYGKMLRLNSDGTVPKDNPFYNKARGKNRVIWARGLRNPFSFAVSRSSGRMFINDVGQKTWEEVNAGVRGANYGWPRHEGPERDRRFKPPVFAYRHGTGPTTGCAITGGAFYDPVRARFPRGYVGDYLFADFCSGWIRRLDPGTRKVTPFASGIANPVDLKVGRGGNLYYLERGTGSVYVVRYTGA
jgi:glucose/arabinose dehydrogenase